MILNYVLGFSFQDGRFLADPSKPNKLHSAVINVTLDSLITKQHVDGVWIDIHNHNTNVGSYVFLFFLNKLHMGLIYCRLRDKILLLLLSLN